MYALMMYYNILLNLTLLYTSLSVPLRQTTKLQSFHSLQAEYAVCSSKLYF